MAGNNPDKPSYIAPKVSKLDTAESYFGGDYGPDDCLENGSNAIGDCRDGSTAAGNGGCNEGFSAAAYCVEGSSGSNPSP